MSTILPRINRIWNNMRKKKQDSNEERLFNSTYRGEGNAAPHCFGVAQHHQEEDGTNDAAEHVTADEGDDAPNTGEDDNKDEGRLDHELGNLHHYQEHDGGKDQTEEAGHCRGVEVRGPIDRAVGVAKGLLEGGRPVRRDDAADGTDVGVEEEGKDGVAASYFLNCALGEVAAGGGSGLDLGCSMIVWAGHRRALDNNGFRHGGQW